MQTKQRTSRKKKPYGPNIVRAWFDTVFHYALRGLEIERGFLVKGNWTFRFGKQALEYLGPVDAHLPAAARENMEQFVSFFPEVSAGIETHDDCERQLEGSCRAYLEAIVEDLHFRETFKRVASKAPQAFGREFKDHFGAYREEKDYMGLLAEYLINGVETLPSHYTTAELWNRYHEQFVVAVSTPELARFRDAVQRSGEAMLQAVDELTSLLKGTRANLSLEFDVPYVAELSNVR
jgi:hypothetical protein